MDEMSTCCSSHHEMSFQEPIKVSSTAHLKLSIDTQVNPPPGTHEFRMLDLCCGQGLAAWGYWLSGRFSQIVGVDIDPKMRGRYSFDFIEADALSLDYDFLMQFDFIHASPPCQGYSKATPRWARGNHQRLIGRFHHMLYAAGVPYVIENVEGSSKELRPNLIMNGQALGLPSDRVRYFHVSGFSRVERKIMRTRPAANVHDNASREDVIAALGLDVINPNALERLTVDGMKQGIPPLMSQWISTRLFSHKVTIR